MVNDGKRIYKPGSWRDKLGMLTLVYLSSKTFVSKLFILLSFTVRGEYDQSGSPKAARYVRFYFGTSEASGTFRASDARCGVWQCTANCVNMYNVMMD